MSFVIVRRAWRVASEGRCPLAVVVKGDLEVKVLRTPGKGKC